MWRILIQRVGDVQTSSVHQTHVDEKSVIKIFNKYFVGYIYIMDLINAWKMKHIKQ